MLITATSDTKSAMTVTTPAAGALSPAADALVLWVGATAGPDNQSINALKRCMETIVENHTPGAATGAKLVSGGAKSSVVFGAGPTVTDADVAIAYGASFNTAASNVNFTSVVKRAIEKFLENRKDN